MAPSWLNLSAHLNKSNVGCIPAVASFSRLLIVSLSLSFFLRFLSHIRHLHPRSFYSPRYSPEGLRSSIVVVASSSLHSTLNVSWWKSLLCRRFYPLPQVNSFERLDSRYLRLFASLSSATYISCWDTLSGNIRYSAVGMPIIIKRKYTSLFNSQMSYFPTIFDYLCCRQQITFVSEINKDSIYLFGLREVNGFHVIY